MKNSQCSLSAFLTLFAYKKDWDLGTCLKNECSRKQLRMPHPLRSWIDLRATYKVSIVTSQDRSFMTVTEVGHENSHIFL